MRRTLPLLWLALLVGAVAGVQAEPTRPPLTSGLGRLRVVPEVLYTPQSGLEATYADAQALAASGQDPSRYRWFSAYNADSEVAAAEAYIDVAYTSNMLNFTKAARVPPAKVNSRLFRVDLDALGIDRKVMDQLGQLGSGVTPFPECYFHRVTVVNGKEVSAVPNWLDQQAVLGLVKLTHTQFPLFRADWFTTYALQPPAYNRFQGNPKNLKDFLKLAGADEESAEQEAGTQLSGAVLFSEVADNNRRVERTPSRKNYGRGCFLRTFDFFGSIRAQNVVKNPLIDQADAGEIIFTTPNGLEGFGLINAVEDAVDFGDPRIVADKRSPLRGRALFNGYRCCFCHARGPIPVEDEIRLTATNTIALLLADIRAGKAQMPRAVARRQPECRAHVEGAYVRGRALLTVKVPADAEVTLDGRATTSAGPVRTYEAKELEAGRDYFYDLVATWTQGRQRVRQAKRVHFRADQSVTVAFRAEEGTLTDDVVNERFRDLYFGEDLNVLLAQDSQNYTAAVRACTGRDAAAVTLAFQETIRLYLDTPLGLEDYALEFGYPVATILSLIEQAGTAPGLDPALVAQLRHRKARRDQFEEAFGQLMQILVLVPEAKK